jgi:CRISPR-associated protein Cmr4
MYRLLFIHALSPLHAGTGQGVGSIDLPIAREKGTGIPYLPGSSLKGVLRDLSAAQLDPERRLALFGPETTKASEHAGALSIGDALLLCFPVRSLAGVFAYATSPYLLERFAREAELVGFSLPPKPRAPQEPTTAYLAPQSKLAYDGKLYLEDLDFKAQEEPSLASWEERLSRWIPIQGRLCLLHDDIMTFLLETATEVTARIRLDDESKTVAQGALWYEESLPAESFLYRLIYLGPSWRTGVSLSGDDLKHLSGAVQLGGKASVGRGLCRLSLEEASRDA